MTKADEIRHIQQMIADLKWQQDPTVVDEINARVLAVFINKTYKGNGYAWTSDNCLWVKGWLLPYMRCPNFLQSLDAIKGLEREGWLLDLLQEDAQGNKDPKYKGYSCRFYKEPTGLQTDKIRLPTEQAARLYAVLETYIYDLTEGEK